ncbi:hypothetical protein TNCV_17931 [Trichonephila clavipes]|nr:hypothetical protein TNCV_17931 [Trichonephila clavipes]
MTPQRASSLLTTSPYQSKDVYALDRLNVHRASTRRVFSGTELEHVTCHPQSDTLTTRLRRTCCELQGVKNGSQQIENSAVF